MPATGMPASEVITSYHELWQVDASFRMSKTDLRARPIFHHTRESIETHLTIVFAALAVARYLQDATGMSIKKIIRTLRPLQQVSLRIAGHDHLAEDPLTPAAKSILDALDLTPQSRTPVARVGTDARLPPSTYSAARTCPASVRGLSH